jgi:dTDP-4-dehydrorhamnose 3,5-epimerase
MNIRLIPTVLAGVVLIEPQVFADERGFFLESWHETKYAEAGLPVTFVQDNVSRSEHGILRGLHVQEPFGQGKLVQVLDGEVFDVAVDIRVGSPTFGRWAGEFLSAANHRQIYVPPGFAHGFCVTSASAIFSYKCTEFYHPETEFSVAWNDPDLNIAWPISAPVVSSKDGRASRLRDIAPSRLPQWHSSSLGAHRDGAI